jgi:hypothetical protein
MKCDGYVGSLSPAPGANQFALHWLLAGVSDFVAAPEQALSGRRPMSLIL